jgi:hypothetical protein
MPENKNIYEGRLALFEHLKGELMILMGVEPSEISSKDELQRAMDEIGDVAEAILQALSVEVLEIKGDTVIASLSIGSIS